MSETKTVLLPIPARLQWENNDGFCGETAIQSFALFYGAWISQKLVRDINKGEYVLEKHSPGEVQDPLKTLTTLHLTFEQWDWENSKQPQCFEFCLWIKKNLLRRCPVMFASFLLYVNREYYDHIMPAVGIEYQNENQYDPRDVLIFYNLFHQEKIRRTMNEQDFLTTKKNCRKHCGEGGSIPRDIDYGIAVTGIIDRFNLTLPVRLEVSSWSEPNTHPAYGEKPIEMKGIVHIEHLIPSKTYVLFRYASYEDVPNAETLDDYFSSKYQFQHQFIAQDVVFIYEDPIQIPSSGSTFYRCIPKQID